MLSVTLAVILRILSNPFSNVFQKNLTNEGLHPLLVNFAAYALLTIFCLPLGIGIAWHSYSSELWLWAILTGILGAIGNGFLVMALQGGELSVLGPINAYKSVVGIIVGFLLLGEMPTLLGLLGVAVIIGGSYLVVDTKSSADGQQGFAIFKRPEIRYRIYALVFAAIEAVTGKRVILLSDVTTSFVLWAAMGAVFSGMMVWGLRAGHRLSKPTKSLKRSSYLAIMALPITIGVMQYCTNYVFKHMEVGYGLALFQLSSIVSVLLGWRIYHEQSIRRKLLGATIMIGGALLIIFG